MKTTFKPLLLPLVLALGTAGLFIARSARGQYNSWCDNPVPTPQPTPQPTPAPPCEPKECDKCTKSPCYVSTGTYVADATDLKVKAIGPPLVVDRHYQSSLAIDGPLGVGWTSSITPRIYYALYLFAGPSTYQKQAYVIMPTGARYNFTDAGNGTFTPPLGRYDTLVRNPDGSFDLTLQRTSSVMHFGVSGALETMKDDYGNSTTWTYDVNGRVQRIADSAGSGRYVDITWGPNGRIATARDSSGRLVQYGFDANGNLTTVTDPGNRVTTYGYIQGRFVKLLNRITDNWGRVITDITYDTTDRVKTYTEKGETYTYTYAYGGNAATTAKTDSQGNNFIYPFGANGLVSDGTPPVGGATHTDYYPDGSVQQFIDGVGVKTYYTYTANGSALTVTKDYQGPDAVRFDYAYDPNFPSKVISITPKDPTTNQVDLDWQAWRYDYYQAGSPAPGALWHVYRVKDTGALETLETHEYNSKGQRTKFTSATGGVTDNGYDAQGNLATVTAPSNNDAGSRPMTTYGYDSLGRLATVTDALTNQTVYVLDALDRPTSITLPKPAVGSPLNFATTTSYDNFDASSGLTFSNTTDPNGRISKQGFDQYGQLGKSVDALGNATSFVHTRGSLTSITDANGNVTSHSYDAARRLVQTTYADGNFEQYEYQADDALSRTISRNALAITYGYDRFRRIKTKTYPGGGGITTWTYLGQKLTQVHDTSVTPAETHLFGYDNSYRVASVTEGSRGTVAYLYNPNDTVASMTVQGGPSTSYTYYPDASLNTLVWSQISGSFKYRYAATGQYQSVTFPSGATRNFSWDNQGRLTQLTNLASGGSNRATYSYGYDFNYTTGQNTMLGQRSSMTATVPSQGLNNHIFKYEYDGVYQLRKVSYPGVAPFAGEVDSWTYDAIGNRLTSTVNSTTQTYSYQKIGSNPLNWQRLLSDGANSYTYDHNGNTLTKGATSLTWNTDDRVTGVVGSSSYSYDFQGRRREKTVGASTSTYVYDGLNLVRETGATPADYLFGPGIDEPLAMSRGGSVYYYLVDGLGSVNAVTNTSAAVQNSYLYDAWGQIRSQTGSLANPFGYTAREFGEAGLQYSRFRWLAPQTGRFMSEDPLASRFVYTYASGKAPLLILLPVYSYASGSPIQQRDPLGLDAGGAGAGDQGALTCVAGCVRQFQIAQLQCLFSKLFQEIGCVALSAACALRPGLSCAGAVLCWIDVGRRFSACMTAAGKTYTECLKGCECP